jgi:hypothetical protein
MSKKIQLTIADPCHENWDAMTQVQQGKFCGSCQKQVVDFTNMNDRQVAEFFKKPSTGSVCGRFMTDQLDREIEIPRKRIPWVKYFFTIALPAIFFTKVSAQKMGKVKAPPTKEPIHTPPTTEFRTLGMVNNYRIAPEDTMKVKINIPVAEVRGLKAFVADAETGAPLDGALVIMNSSIGKENLLSGKDGLFVLNIYRKLTMYGIEISYPGYTRRDIPYGQFKKSADGRIVFTLEKIQVPNPAETVFGGVAIACDRTMGEISMPMVTTKSVGNKITGRVVDENGEPVPFASIESNKPGEGIMANENGIFTINKNWLKKGKSLKISSVGFKSTTIVAGSEEYEGNEIYVQLIADNTLGEVVVSSGYTISCSRTTGLVSVVKGQTIATTVKNENTKVITETKLPMEENKLLVYPNPVAAGTAINLSFKHLAEGYYQLHIISPSGQLILQKEIWIDSEARLLNVDMLRMAAGNYFLVLINKKTGNKYSEKLIIQ